MSQRDLSKANVLVTGASSGIGAALCNQLCGVGANVLATARREDRLKSLADANQGPGSLSFVAGDLTQATHRQNLSDWIGEHWGRLDVLINNAGAGAIGPFREASDDRLRRVMEIDFFAPVALTRLMLPWLVKGSPKMILNIGSVLSHVAVPNKSEYCAAKFALRGWSESIRNELASDGVQVLMLSPSTTSSEFFDSLMDTSSESRSKSVGAMTPEQVAKAAIQSLQSAKRDRILSWGGKGLVWLGRRFPNVMDRVLRQYGR